MGCLKLQYHPQMQVLRIRESERSREEKSAQWFTTPDPLAELRPWHSPYLFCGGNPVRNIDPTGLYSDGAGSQVHESRHGGQVARGEYSFDQKGNPTAGYGLDSEVSAYRAQYAYSGNLSYQQADYFRNNPAFVEGFKALGASVIPATTVNSIHSINRSLIQNIGAEGRTLDGRRTWHPLYRYLK